MSPSRPLVRMRRDDRSLAPSTRLNRQAYNRRNLSIDERRALDEILAEKEASNKAVATLGAAVAVAVAAWFLLGAPLTASASLGYIDNSGMKSYSQVQRAWENNAGKSQRDTMLEMRGVSKPKDGAPESDKSRKRRAMAGCHDDEFRRSAGAESEAACNARVMGGDMEFILDAMN